MKLNGRDTTGKCNAYYLLAHLTSAEKEDAHFCSVHLIHKSNTGPFAAIAADGGVKIQYKTGFTLTNKTNPVFYQLRSAGD